MRKYFTVIISFLALMVMVPGARAGTVPPVDSTAVDLRSYNFAEKGPRTLTGSWMFYWKQYIISAPESSGPSAKAGQAVMVPSTWNSYTDENGEKYDRFGYGSYRISVTLPEEPRIYSIYFRDAGSSYRLYLVKEDGTVKLLGRGGRPGRGREDTVPLFSPTRATENLHGSISLVFEVANFHNESGGLWNPPVIGLTGQVNAQREREKIDFFFVIGCLFFIGIYNLVIFFLRRDEKAPLYLGLFCLVIAFRSFLTLRHFEEVHPLLYMFSLIYKLDILTIYTGILLFVLFLRESFHSVFDSRKVMVVVMVSAAASAVVIVTPPYIFTRTIPFFHFFLLLACLWFIWNLFRAWIKNGMREALISLAGVVALILTVTNDVLYTHQVFDTGFLTHYGLVAFMVSQAFIVAYQNAGARKKMEDLSSELQDLNVNLEKKVSERTGELSRAKGEIEVAMEELEAMNDNLWQANSDLESAQRTMQFDMNMAINVQKKFFPLEAPQSSSWDISFLFQPMSGVSGDLYDFYVEENEVIGVSVFDVSGHGIASGLVTMMAKTTIFRNFREYRDRPLNEVLYAINTDLIDELYNVDNYLTGIIIRIDGAGIEYVNAGHTDLLLRKSDASCRTVGDEDSKGHFLGMPLMKEQFENLTFTVERGDVIVLYTDGLIECHNGDNELFGMKRLREALDSAPRSGSSGEILSFIIDRMNAFREEVKLTDDLTVLVMKKR